MAKQIRVGKHNKAKNRDYKGLDYQYKLVSDLMDRTPDVIYFKDTKGRLIMVNRAHKKGLKLKPKNIIGKTDFDFFPKERAEMMSRDDNYILNTGKPIIDKIERATRPDGVDNYVSTTKIPRFNKKGQIIGIMGITRDITTRMQFERMKQDKERAEKRLEALREIGKMKSEFLAVVSHELRTPLAIIKEAITQVFDCTAGPVNSKQKKLLIKTKENIERLRHMIDGLLDMSRIEKHQLKLHYSLVNLTDLIKGSTEFFRKWAREKHIRLKYDLPKEKIDIFMDAERINQVVTNLINNAIKFTEQNGEISIEVKILENKIRVGVIDTGMGISKQDLRKLFNRFVQVTKIPEVTRKGLGLGLSIAKELIEKHGEIWVESMLGVGSKFYFTLPRFYTIKDLNKRVRDRLNFLLNKQATVYLVNLSIVNLEEFKKRVNARSRKLCMDLKAIADSELKKFSKISKGRLEMTVSDYRNGLCSMIFSEAKEKEIASLCELIKEKIQTYFQKYRTENIFINYGILSYPSQGPLSTTQQLIANVYVKKIFIGSETRRFRRFNYRADIEILHSDRKGEFSQTVDISKGGICFISRAPLETDTCIKIGLKPKEKTRPIYIKGRVAWRKNIEENQKGYANKYKIGLEFIDLKDQSRKLLKIIKAISR